MYIIGLTGMIASGKSVVSAYLKKKGYLILDADKISHDIILRGTPAYDEIVDCFGSEYIDRYGEINRRKLGLTVFAEKDKLEELNRIVHPKVIAEIKRFLQEDHAAVIIDAALLVQSGLDRLCDEIWNICAQRDLRIKRIMQRDNLDEIQAMMRVDQQQTTMPTDKPVYIIENSGTYEHLIEQVENQLKRIKKDEKK